MSRPTVIYEPPALRHIHPLAALRRLRQFRDLFITLSLHRINVRYQQSRLGILWAVIQPLSMMVVFTLMFTLVRANPGGSVPFPLFAYAALVPWTLFSSGLSAASAALTSHASLLTKVAFPREILPLTYIVAALVDFVLSSVVLLGLMLWFGVTPSWTAVWALPAILLLVVFLIGLALLLAAMQVRYRDVGLAMPLLLQVWLFASPVLYALAAVKHALPEPLYFIYTLNPLVGIVDTFRRAIILQQSPDYFALGISAAVALLLLPVVLSLLQVRRADGRRHHMSALDISVQNVGKEYRLGASRGASTFWALRDVSLDVPRGSSVGIIGRNGAGKSTLFKLLAGITAPTTGRIVLNGRLAALIEVGSGFHPELTGRENVFLSGSLLGMTRREIAGKLDRIVEFAGVRRFIDTPVKRYSSGMYVRLGFAIAAHLEPHILLVDEVLAVGDAEFQARCLQRIQELRAQGTTCLFISHDLTAIERLCDRAVLLERGEIAATGTPTDVVATYHRRMIADANAPGEPVAVALKSGVTLTNLAMLDPDAPDAVFCRTGGPLVVSLKYEATRRTRTRVRAADLRSRWPDPHRHAADRRTRR